MKQFLIATLAGLSFAMAMPSIAGPDETQKRIIQQAQEAKKKLAAAQAAQGAERQKMMQEHMKTYAVSSRRDFSPAFSCADCPTRASLLRLLIPDTLLRYKEDRKTPRSIS